MHPDHRKLLEEVARRTQATKIPDVLSSAFPQQLNFIKDPHRQKALFCTRRAAKSYTAGLYLVYEALTHPGSNCWFIGLTRESAKDIIWKDILKVIDNKFDLKMEFNQSSLTATLPNGSIIKVMGVDKDQDEMNKLLGKKFRLVCIDEASMYSISISNLVNLIRPGTTDEAGTICLMGTASNFPRGLFFDITQNKRRDWKSFSWTAFDNPHTSKQWATDIAIIKDTNPLYLETPQFKQWYLNEWTIDESKLCYRFNPSRNLADGTPNPFYKLPSIHNRQEILDPDWSFCLGIDLGWEDDNAWVLTAYHGNDPVCYVLKTYHEKKLTFDQCVDKTFEFLKDKNGNFMPCKVIIDGANKQGVESMRARSNIPFEAADKNDKVTFMELLNADLVQAKVKLFNNASTHDLQAELASLVWVTEGDQIKYPKKENPSLSNHLCFVAGTLIQTGNQRVPIESLKCGDLVETRAGPRLVKNCIRSFSPVLKLKLSNRAEIICTPDHPFWSDGKWIAAKDLKPSNRLLSWNQHLKERHELAGMEGFTGVTKGTSPTRTQIKSLKYNTSTAISGNLLTGQFQKLIIFTIRMGTVLTTSLKTWNAYLVQSIKNSIPQRVTLKSSINTGILLPSGMEAKKELSGIDSTPKILISEILKPMRSVLGVKQFTKNLLAIKKDAVLVNALQQNGEPQESMTRSVPARIAQTFLKLINMVSKSHAPLSVLSITAIGNKDRPNDRPKEVFNITVEDQHEYFANGVLVSNCDAFLYAWRNGFHYHWAPKEVKHPAFSKEWYSNQAVDWDKEREKLENSTNWNDNSGFPDEFNWELVKI